MFDSKTAIQDLEKKLDTMSKKDRDAYLRQMGFSVASAKARRTGLHPKRHFGKTLSISLYSIK